MMTFIYILGGLIVLILILHIFAPKSYNVFRKIEVNQKPDVVFRSLRSLQEQDKWSPWMKRDPNVKIEYFGTDGEVGSYTRWMGNKQIGEGEQEITLLEEPNRIESELRFLKPWEATSKAYFELKETDKGTEVTWGFSGRNKFPFTVMTLFMSMDKIVGKDFEEGLNFFKKYIEQ